MRTLAQRPTYAVIKDVDGVSFPFDLRIGDCLAEMLDRPRTDFPPAEIFQMNEAWGLGEWSEFVPLYRRAILEYDLCRSGVPNPGSIAGWQALRSLDVHIVIATDCGTDGARLEAQGQRAAWLSDWGFDADEIIFTADKASVATDLLARGFSKVFSIEDRDRNFDALAAAGASSYLVDQRWNRLHKIADDSGRRVRNLAEFAEAIAGEIEADKRAATPTSQAVCAHLVGMPEAEAYAAVGRIGFGATRVVKRNGRPLVVTRDFRVDRINIEIDNGIVVAAHVG